MEEAVDVEGGGIMRAWGVEYVGQRECGGMGKVGSSRLDFR